MMKWIKTLLEMGRVFCSSIHKLVLSVLRIVKVYLLVTGQGPPIRNKARAYGFWG